MKQLDRVPLLLSAAQVAKQRPNLSLSLSLSLTLPLNPSPNQAAKQSVLETETPLPTAGLDLALLPASSRLDANGFGEHKTCAVVGASG